MNYKCKICGWKKEQGSLYWTTEDHHEVFEHEKTHRKYKCDTGIPKNRG